MNISRFALVFTLLGLGSLCAQTTTLNLSTDLTTLGIASGNMVPNQSTLDSGPLFEAAIKYANTHQITSVIATTGSYYFLSGSASSSGTHVLLNGVTTPMTIDLQGSDLYFGHPEKQGFFLANLTNVTLQNFTMDYLQQRYTQLAITGVNTATRQLQFTVQPGWQNPSTLAALLPTVDPSGAAVTSVYVFRNGQPWTGYTQMPVTAAYTDSALTLDASVPAATIAGIRVGDLIVLDLRAGGTAVLATGLTGCTLRNIKIYSGQVGLRSTTNASTLLEHVEVVPRPGTDRLVSTVADGISPSQPGPNDILRLCRAIRTLDDGLSPNTYVFGSVQSSLATRSLQIQGDADTAFNGSYALPNGSNVVFERASDGTILGSAVVVSQATATSIGGLPELTVNFDRDLPSGLVGSWMYPTDASWRGGNLLLERNAVEQQGWARGISLWGLMNTTLYGNYIHRSTFAGVAIMHQLFAGDWHVPPVVNLTMTNNVIDGTILAPDIHKLIELAAVQSIAVNDSSAPMTGSPHQNFSLTANFIADSGRSALWLGNLTGGVADLNYLFNPDNNPNQSLAYPQFSAQELQPLVVESSSAVTLGTNSIDTASIRAFVTDSTFHGLAAYLPGATIQLNAFNVGTLASPAVSLTDADGKIWPLAVSATSTHAVDAVLPAGVGLGGAVVSLKAGTASYLGTLFIDSQDSIPAQNHAGYFVSPSTTSVSAAGGTVSFLVATQGTNAYSVTATDSFVTPGAGGAGTGIATVTLAANTGGARTTTVEIAQQPITLTQAGSADPVIGPQPASQTVTSGGSAVFTSAVTGAISYQWYFNGVAIPGATAATLTVPGVTAGSAGSYQMVATDASGSATSRSSLLTVTPATNVTRLGNLSILTTLSAASPQLTMGTVIGGSGTAGSKEVLFRAAGPTLAAFLTGVNPDPQMSIFAGSTLIASDDNWGGTQTLMNAFAAVGAFPFASTTSKDAAFYNPAVQGGLYSVQVSGVGGATGQALAEIWDSTPSSQFTSLTPRLVNVSVLKTLAASEMLTAGFIIYGTAPEQVLIRADGPALGIAPFNLGGVMADPQITLYNNSGSVIASNDNWGTPTGTGAATAAQLNAAFSLVRAFALPPGSQDAAILVTLLPGNYSAAVSGNNGSSGQAIVEVYEVPSQ